MFSRTPRSGYIESFNSTEDLAVGKVPYIGELPPSYSANSPDYEDNDFNFKYPTTPNIKNTTRSATSMSSRPSTARPCEKYNKIHENDDVFIRAQQKLMVHDQNTARRKKFMHDEFEQNVLNQIDNKYRAQLTGRKYQSRAQSKLRAASQLNSKPIDNLQINTSGCEDRLMHSRLNSRQESRIEKILKQTNEKEEPEPHKFEMDPRRKVDTRFFTYEIQPKKGTRFYPDKFASKVYETINQFPN